MGLSSHLPRFCNSTQHVIIDSDIAELYGVETSKSVSRNQEKFPSGYVIELKDEKDRVVTNCDHQK